MVVELNDQILLSCCLHPLKRFLDDFVGFENTEGDNDFTKIPRINKKVVLQKSNVGNAAMQSELAVMTEINLQLWDSALQSTLSSITKKSYPHVLVVQRLLYLALVRNLWFIGYCTIDKFLYQN